MMAVWITAVIAVLEIIDQIFGVQIGLSDAGVKAIEIFLAAVTPLLAWFGIHWKP